MTALIIFIIAIALCFDFLNGFHDAANSIATVVSTRVLSPVQAVIWAAFFNFIAAFLLNTHVANTVAKGLVVSERIDPYVILAALLGAVTWNIITWLLALPTSSSHALFAGLAGAAIAAFGFEGTLIASGWIKVLAFLILSPIIGFVLGAANMVVVSWIVRRQTPSRVDKLFRRLQLVSAGGFSLGHGFGDAQKTMGVIVVLLLSFKRADWAYIDPHAAASQQHIAWWIILACHAAIALGTMFGGWRIVKTMGSNITRLQPVGGFCAETAGAFTTIGTACFGIPISTTHAITGSILGVGSVRNVRSVRWIWGQRIVMAWILTLPCAATLAAISYLVIAHTLKPYLQL